MRLAASAVQVAPLPSRPPARLPQERLERRWDCDDTVAVGWNHTAHTRVASGGRLLGTGMDPQSFAFIPQSDIWRLSTSMRTLQEAQQDHADRLIRLERRQEDDARMKSVWGTTSPFPGVLSGTPQGMHFCDTASLPRLIPRSTGPAQHGHDFANFDEDQSNSMVRSLHLDAEEEPRRFNLSSRANSVRFDESANTAWSHASKPSVELLSRNLGGLGHPMFERSASHKSDGRQSSAGQSAISGRANSLGLEINHPSVRSPGPPGLAPGLFILGSVPSIIRCWVTSEFKHDSLLYAAVCTGSYRSMVEGRLLERLGLTKDVSQDINGRKRIKLPVYLPEAIFQTTSSQRSSSPTPPLPSLLIDFAVIDSFSEDSNPRSVQIILGSDTLRAHNADILMSQNSIALYDDDRNKLSIPMVRPEHEETFKTLRLTSATPLQRQPFQARDHMRTPDSRDESVHGTNGFDLEPPRGRAESQILSGPSYDVTSAREELIEGPTTSSAPHDEDVLSPQANSTSNVKYPQESLGTREEEEEEEAEALAEQAAPVPVTSRNSPAPAIWSNWRRDGPHQASQNDWASASRSYQRPNRDQGIKVLKPIRQTSRPAIVTTGGSPVSGQSRYFDDGKRRVAGTDEGRETLSSDNPVLSAEPARSGLKDGSVNANAPAPKPTRINPVGGASAFGWLNSSQR